MSRSAQMALGRARNFRCRHSDAVRDFYDIIVGLVYRPWGGIACNLLYRLTRAVGALVRAVMCRAT
jgi:hypothetical protein